ncbi:hypothetical protein C8R42DRAFT_681925 [Lentinula raphanica]|nr:hypothetical protein C8R42DRAFT_681925 [Lentinula raphanica]
MHSSVYMYSHSFAICSFVFRNPRIARTGESRSHFKRNDYTSHPSRWPACSIYSYQYLIQALLFEDIYKLVHQPQIYHPGFSHLGSSCRIPSLAKFSGEVDCSSYQTSHHLLQHRQGMFGTLLGFTRFGNVPESSAWESVNHRFDSAACITSAEIIIQDPQSCSLAAAPANTLTAMTEE